MIYERFMAQLWHFDLACLRGVLIRLRGLPGFVCKVYLQLFLTLIFDPSPFCEVFKNCYKLFNIFDFRLITMVKWQSMTLPCTQFCFETIISATDQFQQAGKEDGCLYSKDAPEGLN